MSLLKTTISLINSQIKILLLSKLLIYLNATHRQPATTYKFSPAINLIRPYGIGIWFLHNTVQCHVTEILNSISLLFFSTQFALRILYVELKRSCGRSFKYESVSDKLPCSSGKSSLDLAAHNANSWYVLVAFFN